MSNNDMGNGNDRSGGGMARNSVLGIRFNVAEKLYLSAASAGFGEAVSAYVRRVALESARRDLSAERVDREASDRSDSPRP